MLDRERREYRDFEQKLRDFGIEVEDFELLTHRQISEAMDVFLEALAGDYSLRAKDGIVSVLSGVKTDPQPLLEHFERALEAQASEEPGAAGYAWTIAEVLSRIANEETYDRILELFHDREHSDARQMLAYALARVKSRRDETVAAFIEHLDDEPLLLQILSNIGKLKAVEAVPKIRPLLEHPRKPVQAAAKKALLKIEKNPKRFQRVETLRKVPLGDLSETSSTMDIYELEPLLLDLIQASLLGISPGVGKELAAFVSLMELDLEDYFEVDARGEPPTWLYVFVDDVDSCQFAFLGAEERIQEIDGYLERAFED